jgi:hypothetical protein
MQGHSVSCLMLWFLHRSVPTSVHMCSVWSLLYSCIACCAPLQLMLKHPLVVDCLNRALALTS